MWNTEFWPRKICGILDAEKLAEFCILCSVTKVVVCYLLNSISAWLHFQYCRSILPRDRRTFRTCNSTKKYMVEFRIPHSAFRKVFSPIKSYCFINNYYWHIMSCIQILDSIIICQFLIGSVYSHDGHVLQCVYMLFSRVTKANQTSVVGVRQWLNTCGKPQLPSACVAQLAALWAAMLVTGVWIPPVPFFGFFLINLLNSVFGLFSNIKPLTIWFNFFHIFSFSLLRTFHWTCCVRSSWE